MAALLPIGSYSSPLAQEEFDSVVRSKPDVVHGESLFSTCAACHGVNGAGASDGTVPAIAGQHFRVIAHELVAFRHDQRWDVRMEHFSAKRHLNGPQDIADVAAYVSHLAPTAAPAHGSGEYIARGEALFGQLCASCHGARAQGDDLKRYPRIAGQHYEYLMHEMQDAVEGRRPNLWEEHFHLLRSLESADVMGISDYLSRLGP
jgi:cytochrome c553